MCVSNVSIRVFDYDYIPVVVILNPKINNIQVIEFLRIAFQTQTVRFIKLKQLVELTNTSIEYM